MLYFRKKSLSVTGILLSLLAACCASPVQGQDTRAFSDVPTADPAYRVSAELQRKDIITGYPVDYFTGARALTRYEFAVALQRALDKLHYAEPDAAEIGNAHASPSLRITPPAISAELLAQIRKLVEEFKSDLTGLGTDVTQVNSRLDQLAQHLALTATHSPLSEGSEPAAGSDLPFSIQNRSHINFLDPRVAIHGTSDVDFLTGASRSPFAPTALQRGAGMHFGVENALGETTGAFTSAGTGSEQNTEMTLVLPLTRRSRVGLSLHDDLMTEDLLSSNPYHSTTYGTDITLNPTGRLTLGAEALRNITERLNVASYGQDAGAASPLDTNSYRLKVGYDAGRTRAVLGYQVGDPMPYSGLNPYRSLIGMSPANNVEGPYTRLDYSFSDRLQTYVGGDYYANTGFRPAMGDPTSNPLLTGNGYRGAAGIRWNPTHRLSLTADFEGVLYDLSGSMAYGGRRIQPIEQYLTLGAGLHLNSNAVLRLAYQIYNQQDGSGNTDSLSGQGYTSVFTTQFFIHF